MCSNYLPVTRQDRLLTFFGVEYTKAELLQREAFPLGMAPFIRLSVEGQEGGRPALVAETAMFGLLPHFAAERQYGRRTYNAIGTLLTVRTAQFLQDQQHRDVNGFPWRRSGGTNSPETRNRSPGPPGIPDAQGGWQPTARRAMKSRYTLHVSLLGDLKRIVDLDPKVPNSAFELRVPQQQLHGA